MCETCGCGDSDLVPVEVQERILSANDKAAKHNRTHFAASGTTAVNLMGSPGSGKTAVLEATAAMLGDRRRLGAMSGDLETERDAERLRRVGVPAAGITTGSACHLDAELVHRALHDLEGGPFDLLFIENVGNLVCPAIYDLGQAANVVVLSVTEGDDKPLKYPVMFRTADLVLLTKIDLLPHLPDVDASRILENLEKVMPDPKLIELSSITGEGLDDWIDWLETQRRELATARGGTASDRVAAGASLQR